MDPHETGIFVGLPVDRQHQQAPAQYIPFGLVGAVTNSDRPGHRVRVQDDRENTGGFLIFEWWHGSNGPNESGAFDSWVQTQDDLISFIQHSGWQIDWGQP